MISGKSSGISCDQGLLSLPKAKLLLIYNPIRKYV